jgi:hypothetical protein
VPDRYHPRGLAAIRAASTLGLCLFCSAPLPEAPGRQALICGSAPCRRAYIAAYYRDRRAGAPRVNTPPGWRIRWICGCGRSYVAESFKAHRCLFWREAWPVVTVQSQQRRAA